MFEFQHNKHLFALEDSYLAVGDCGRKGALEKCFVVLVSVMANIENFKYQTCDFTFKYRFRTAWRKEQFWSSEDVHLN